MARTKEERAARARAYHAAHKEERNARARAYNAAHKEEKAARTRAYYTANKEAHNARARAYRETLGPRGMFAAWLRHKYDLSFEAWTEVLVGQSGRCAICAEVLNPHGVATDHDHETGEVRSLLCISCNCKLHALEKWPHREAALAYLDRHKARPLRIVRE